MTTFEMITVRMNGGEQITITSTDVNLFSRDGRCVGNATMGEFLDFLKETLADVKYDASTERGMDAETT